MAKVDNVAKARGTAHESPTPTRITRRSWTGRLISVSEDDPDQAAAVSTEFEYDRRGRIKREVMTRSLIVDEFA